MNAAGSPEKGGGSNGQSQCTVGGSATGGMRLTGSLGMLGEAIATPPLCCGGQVSAGAVIAPAGAVLSSATVNCCFHVTPAGSEKSTV